MNFSLIICTYLRPVALSRLLQSVAQQSLYPNEILIIDGSTNEDTREMLSHNTVSNLKYYKVDDATRGLTRQRNFGIEQCGGDIDVVCFLDDDVLLQQDYFKNLLATYTIHPDALGVGGYITNQAVWKPQEYVVNKQSLFCYDGFCRKEGSRFVLRKKIGLAPDKPPGYLPKFGHGRSVSFLPPSGKIYSVEQFMGGVSSFKKEVFKKISFSEYFEGYGLYEDADFTLRLSKLGKLYVNTTANLEHHHEPSGRPDHYKYGKMVIRNGYYIWKTHHPKVGLKNKIKWVATAFLLTFVRLANAITSTHKKAPFREAMGRCIGLISLVYNKPKAHA